MLVLQAIGKVPTATMNSNQAEQPNDSNISSEVTRSQANDSEVNATQAHQAVEEANSSPTSLLQGNQDATTDPSSNPTPSPDHELLELGSGTPNTPVQQQGAVTTANAEIHSQEAFSPSSDALHTEPVNSEQIFCPPPTAFICLDTEPSPRRRKSITSSPRAIASHHG